MPESVKDEIDKLNRQRDYWHNKARKQLDDLFMKSLDGDRYAHEGLLEELETTTIIVWRLDSRLRDLQKAVSK